MTNVNGARRVVVTGMGVVSAIGIGQDAFWDSLKNGRCGIGEVEGFDTSELRCKIAAEVKDFDPKIHVKSRAVQLGDRYSQFAGTAAEEAVEQSGIAVPFEDPYRAAAIIGSGIGGLTTLEDAYHGLFAEGKRATHPLTLLRAIGSSASAHVSIEYGIKGPTFGVVSACSTATHAIGLTYQMIQSGMVDSGVAGATEASLCLGATRAWQALHVLSEKGLFPFSKERNGTVLGEGGGVLVLEELEHAKARGANIIAEIKGFGTTSDAADMVNPDIDGASGAIEQAMAQAGLSGSDIDYINAHGTATTINDVNETQALKKVFGKAINDIPISSTKSMHGHCLGGGGAVESIACLLAMQNNFVPPTINLNEADPECDLDYIPNQGREKEVNYTVCNSFAFGGLNAVLVFGPDPS